MSAASKWAAIKQWMAGTLLEPSPLLVEPEADPRAHLVCGVPDCEDGVIVDEGPPVTVVECDTHNARTTHDTVKKKAREQRIIRVQDAWRQHGTKGPPR